jgi:alkylation response protein AidB-like acyl-CoA dehydrogenase
VGLALTDEHLELAATVRRWTASRQLIADARDLLEAPEDRLPTCWSELVEHRWARLAVSEANGGDGFGVAELAVVLEELGRAGLPGPFLPTVVVALALDRWAADPDGARPRLAALLDGGAGGFARSSTIRLASGRANGAAELVWSGALADQLLLPVELDEAAASGGGSTRWWVVDRATVEIRERPSFDATRRMAEVRLDEVALDAAAALSDEADVERLVGLLAAAEAVGLADWCVATASTYAVEREQFGRPIGQFQAVKHRCADMLVALEAARAAVWDAARSFDERDLAASLVVDIATALAPEAAFRCAEDCVQVLGGIGYTWEHDAHLYLKRATAVRHLLDSPSRCRQRIASATAAGVRRHLSIDLPSSGRAADEAAEARADVQALVAKLRDLDKSEWRTVLADEGYLVPHWPRPWGREATPVQQLVIDEELRHAHVRRPHLAVAGWALPTIIAHGTPDQWKRFVGPTLRGELTWCQMFSEPGAGSDLASLSTRAVRVDGGWSLTGQKVWTSMAREADVAICLARTDPDAPRHEGIGCFLVDMSTPGLDVRPLRELTGMAMFNEVFLTDVFVADEDLVGSPTEGWSYARTTLANERVSMASGSSFGPGVAALFELARSGEAVAGLDDPLVAELLGGLVADAHAVAALGMRATLRALGDGPAGPEASVRKLAGVTHEQAVQEAGLGLLGPAAAVLDGPGGAWSVGFLGNRCLSIAGGTSEIQRNVIAERLLGLPKDP